ncbi:ferredoxin [Streptomyces kaniharaensis]|uniref:Ferredoxin n=1 Tax=Streptomyces kaniharaensis TaxID=212423 RepID=A0A6N7KZA3_9ACTN|nr:ferredoxin [Streptomyces kaniharaensis]MQS17026.1 ferredoxin [Streptomyces kaniharaensis]
MRITLDEDRCCGAGTCVMTAPDVFDQRDDGIVVLLDPNPPAQLATSVHDAAARCPAAAIRVETE